MTVSVTLTAVARYFLSVFIPPLFILQKWDPEENPAGYCESKPGLRGEPVHVPGQILEPEYVSYCWTLVCYMFRSWSDLLTLEIFAYLTVSSVDTSQAFL